MYTQFVARAWNQQYLVFEAGSSETVWNQFFMWAWKSGTGSSLRHAHPFSMPFPWEPGIKDPLSEPGTEDILSSGHAQLNFHLCEPGIRASRPWGMLTRWFTWVLRRKSSIGDMWYACTLTSVNMSPTRLCLEGFLLGFLKERWYSRVLRVPPVPAAGSPSLRSPVPPASQPASQPAKLKILS